MTIKGLNDEHLKDLHKSGLTDKTIRAAGIYSIKTGWEGQVDTTNGVRSKYAIPYDLNSKQTGEFVRTREFYSTKKEEKEKGKYHQPPGTECRALHPTDSRQECPKGLVQGSDHHRGREEGPQSCPGRASLCGH